VDGEPWGGASEAALGEVRDKDPSIDRRELTKLGMIITQTDPETVFNARRLALHSLEQGDQVRIFLSGKGVEIDRIEAPKFDARGQAQKVLESEVCALSRFKDPKRKDTER